MNGKKGKSIKSAQSVIYKNNEFGSTFDYEPVESADNVKRSQIAAIKDADC